ncbi:hypothetical protein HAX54_052621 [Datura stramonium]|uniref:Uncharacterized protein n=1 Tax=Datura stramonium TaxID=4076 RepID=A0ABS8WRB4_DATST|nr:hypothetical protein [Datura stramonium]
MLVLWDANNLELARIQKLLVSMSAPIDENSYGNQVNSEDEHSEYDSNYGEKQESDSEEDLDEEFEECDSSDKEALIDAFAPKTSWKGEKVKDAMSQHR